MTTTRSTGPTGPQAGSSDERGRGRSGALVALGLVASLLVAAGWLLPIWQARLHAPQYPGGLTTVAYGHQVTGDINEVNALNHYVGLGVFDPADVPEMQLWPFALIAAVIAVVVALLLRRRWPGRLATIYLWALPFGVLAAIQFRLYEFGQDITPGAAFRLDPFVPWVVGRSTVWNFETWAWPGWGLISILGAAAVVTFGPRLLERRSGGGTGAVPAVGVGLLVVSLTLGAGLGLASPAQAQDHGDHGDHGSHDHGSHEGRDDDAPPAPQIGPSAHPAMPVIVEHAAAGDLADLLEATEPGGHLRLPAGTYRGPVVIDEPVILEGEDLPIIQGDGTGSVITVRAPGTVIRGLVVRGSGAGPTDNPAGIRIEADDVTVEGVVVEDSYMGIAVDSAAAAKLVDNHIHGRMQARIVDEGHAVAHDDEADATHDHGDHADHVEHAEHGDHADHADHADHDHADHAAHADHADHGDHDHAAHADHGDHGDHGHRAVASVARGTPSRGDGIWLHDVDHVLVRGNHIEHARDGIYVSFGSGAVIDSNHVHRSRYAVHSMFARELSIVQNHFSTNLSGTVLMYGGDVLLLRNHIEDNTSASTGFGAILKDIVDVELVQNIVVGNRIGLHLDGPTETTLTANTIARHTIGVQAHSSVKATFSGNSFVDNAIQVVPLGTRFQHVAWSANGWGNYWSSYRGYDARGEGKGAVAHTEGGSVDRLLARNPELLAIAGSPAMQLLRSVEERWGRRNPVVVDELPLTVPVSPALPAAAADPGARNLALALGLVLLVPAVGLVARRSHRRPTTSSRRSLRAVHA
jgi:nitrous oxidase accessory protein